MAQPTVAAAGRGFASAWPPCPILGEERDGAPGSLLGARAQRCPHTVGRTDVSMQEKYPLEGTVRSRVGARSSQRGRRAGFGSSGRRTSTASSPQPSRLSQPGVPTASASLPPGTVAWGAPQPGGHISPGAKWGFEGYQEGG